MSPFGEKIIDRDRLVVDKRKFLRRPPSFKKPPQLVGARNPYAIYRAIHHENPFPDKTPQEVRDILDGSIWKKLDYNHLFDPRWGSCLFCQKMIDATRLHHDVIYAPGDSSDFDLNSDQKSKPSSETPSIDVMDGTPTFSGCSENLLHAIWDFKSQTDPENPASLFWPWFKDASGSFPEEVSQAFDDPVQGPVLDCYFLAPLSSIAWHYALYPNADSSRKIVSDPAKQIPFWANDGTKISIGGNQSVAPGTDYKIVHTDYSLPTDTRHIPVGATSVGESWVPFYEKAFARYLEDTGKMIPPSSDNRYPDICRIPCGNPGETLRALLQKPSSSLKAHNMENKTLDSNERNPITVFNVIKALCETGLFLPGKSLKTKYPTIARTNCTGDPDVTGNPTPPPCAAPKGSGVDYTDDLIVASHSYSVLGIHKESTGNYVILRNPYGENWGFILGQQNYTIAAGPLVFNSIKVGVKAYTRELFVDQNGSRTPKGGVFALKIEDFVKYFAEVNWIVM